MISYGVNRLIYGLFLLIGFVPTAASAGEPGLVLVAPGTVVGKKVPTGWTNLVLKSIPRLATGDLGTLPATSARTASLFRTVILANIAPDPTSGRFQLAKVGMGLCIPFEGQDEVVDPESVSPAAKSLGTIDRIVLGEAFRELNRGRLIAQGPTFAIYRAPTTMLMGKGHHKILLCYVLRVDPISGALTTFLWWTLDEPPAKLVAKSLVQLAPDLQLDCGIDVRATRVFGMVPVSWSFGMAALPPGRTLRLAVEEVALIERVVRDAGSSEELERIMLALESTKSQ